MQSQTAFLLVTLSSPALVNASPESTQLALALKQLDGIKTSLERVRSSGSICKHPGNLQRPTGPFADHCRQGRSAPT